MDNGNVGVIQEQGDLGLGFFECTEEEIETVNKNKKENENEK